MLFHRMSKKKKVKWSRYRPRVAQRVGRGTAILFHDCGTRRGWVVSSTPWLHFTPGKDLIPIAKEAGWAPGTVWTARKSHPHRDSIPDRPVHNQLLYRLSYHTECLKVPKNDPNVNTHFIKTTPLIVTLLASSRYYVHFCTVISKNMDCQVQAAKFEGMKAWQHSASH